MYTEGEVDFHKSHSSDLIWRGTKDDLSWLCRLLGHFEALKARSANKETCSKTRVEGSSSDSKHR